MANAGDRDIFSNATSLADADPFWGAVRTFRMWRTLVAVNLANCKVRTSLAGVGGGGAGVFNFARERESLRTHTRKRVEVLGVAATDGRMKNW